MHIYRTKVLTLTLVMSILILLLLVLLPQAFDLKSYLAQLGSSDVKIFDVEKIPNIPEKICDIRDYGAQEGANTLSTIAINAAVDDCHFHGGGTVFIPKGEWFSGGIKLKSNIHLFLAEDSKIIFSTDLEDYLPVVLTRFQGIDFYNFSPLIYAVNGRNIAISGTGKLIGNGEARDQWTGGGNFDAARGKLFTMSQDDVSIEERIFGNEEPGLRPSFIQFMNCKDILLDGFTVENGPMWTIHPVYSENFVVRNINIDTWSGNTDGIVIDSTKNVVIENSHFSTGDDAVVIKSGLDGEGRDVGISSEKILIKNIIVVKGNSGVSIGSEMSGGVRDVEIRDSIFTNTFHGFRIKSTRSRGGFIDNILVENVEMNNIIGDVIDINLSYSSSLQSKIANKPIIKNIYINDIHGKNAHELVLNIDGLSDSVMENIRMENITFKSSARAVSFKKARNVFLNNIRIETQVDPQFEIERCQNITIKDSTCRDGADPCFLISGKSTRSISVNNIDSSRVVNFFEKVTGVMWNAVTIDDDVL